MQTTLLKITMLMTVAGEADFIVGMPLARLVEISLLITQLLMVVLQGLIEAGSIFITIHCGIMF